MAHEIGHDFGFADKYLRIGLQGFAAVIKGHLNTLMGDSHKLTQAEAEALGTAIENSGIPNGVYSPVNMQADLPKVGSVVDAYLPSAKGGLSEDASKVKVTGGNASGTKTLSGKPIKE